MKTTKVFNNHLPEQPIMLVKKTLENRRIRISRQTMNANKDIPQNHKEQERSGMLLVNIVMP